MIAKTRRQALMASVSLALASGLILGACGSAVRAASAGVPATTSGGVRVVHDPDNPYWAGAVQTSGGDTAGRRAVHDPDNPFWSGTAATTSSAPAYAEPLRGPR